MHKIGPVGAPGAEHREQSLPVVSTSSGRESYKDSPTPTAGPAQLPPGTKGELAPTGQPAQQQQLDFEDRPRFAEHQAPRLPETPIIDRLKAIRERERERLAASANLTGAPIAPSDSAGGAPRVESSAVAHALAMHSGGIERQ